MSNPGTPPLIGSSNTASASAIAISNQELGNLGNQFQTGSLSGSIHPVEIQSAAFAKAEASNGYQKLGGTGNQLPPENLPGRLPGDSHSSALANAYAEGSNIYQGLGRPEYQLQPGSPPGSIFPRDIQSLAFAKANVNEQFANAEASNGYQGLGSSGNQGLLENSLGSLLPGDSQSSAFAKAYAYESNPEYELKPGIPLRDILPENSPSLAYATNGADGYQGFGSPDYQSQPGSPSEGILPGDSKILTNAKAYHQSNGYQGLGSPEYQLQPGSLHSYQGLGLANQLPPENSPGSLLPGDSQSSAFAKAYADALNGYQGLFSPVKQLQPESSLDSLVSGDSQSTAVANAYAEESNSYPNSGSLINQLQLGNQPSVLLPGVSQSSAFTNAHADGTNHNQGYSLGTPLANQILVSENSKSPAFPQWYADRPNSNQVLGSFGIPLENQLQSGSFPEIPQHRGSQTLADAQSYTYGTNGQGLSPETQQFINQIQQVNSQVPLPLDNQKSHITHAYLTAVKRLQKLGNQWQPRGSSGTLLPGVSQSAVMAQDQGINSLQGLESQGGPQLQPGSSPVLFSGGNPSTTWNFPSSQIQQINTVQALPSIGNDINANQYEGTNAPLNSVNSLVPYNDQSYIGPSGLHNTADAHATSQSQPTQITSISQATADATVNQPLAQNHYYQNNPTASYPNSNLYPGIYQNQGDSSAASAVAEANSQFINSNLAPYYNPYSGNVFNYLNNGGYSTNQADASVTAQSLSQSALAKANSQSSNSNLASYSNPYNVDAFNYLNNGGYGDASPTAQSLLQTYLPESNSYQYTPNSNPLVSGQLLGQTQSIGGSDLYPSLYPSWPINQRTPEYIPGQNGWDRSSVAQANAQGSGEYA